ncbi:hypothetical protein [Rubellicoccus peritrichatus]|uniref:Uncharacterized protein n=1 Tax=Rubellicoccus peritrichatus TaxID=3080537 RepID=A0AAQ3L5F8_9BACT|nr:hypothetical protein [Puniceicoccus sp. CR14]WOO39341.1 hypothetical protein RZN69_12015 [Puniceicoccus sp. CR14]
MKAIGITVISLFTATSFAFAGETAGGTLIELSGVGGFVLLTSILMLLGKRNPDGRAARFLSKFFGKN